MMQIRADELADFFQLLGQATYYVQHVENSLHVLLAIGEFEGPQSVSQAEADAVIEKYRRKTLGGLLTALEDREFSSAIPLAKLRALNDDRKWLAHRLLTNAEYRLGSDPAYRDLLVRRLGHFVEEAQRLNKEVGAAVEALTLSKGVSQAAIDRAFEREVEKIR